MEKQSVVITEVEDFIKRYHSGDLILTPEATKMVMIVPHGKNILRMTRKVHRNFPDSLAHMIATYQLDKDHNPRDQVIIAYDLLDVIERGRAWGIIRDQKQQARAYEQEIEQLKERVNILIELNKKLASENKMFHNLLPKAKIPKGKNSEVGDVEES